MKKLITILLVAFAFTYSVESFAQVTYKLNQSFETWPATGWVATSILGAQQWTQGTTGIAALFPPFPDGSNCAAIDYETAGGDDWLVTPQVMGIVAGDSLVFRWVKRYSDGPYPPDSCIVRLSTTTFTPNIATFNKTLLRICVHCTPIGVQTWNRVSIPLTPYIGQNIYIAFQHKDVDGHGMGLDLVQVKNNGVGINEVSSASFSLYQNYPNPFSKSTMISFELKNSDFVKITVLDVLGKEVATLINQNMTAGTHSVTFNAENIKSGVYFYKMETTDFNETKVMIVE